MNLIKYHFEKASKLKTIKNFFSYIVKVPEYFTGKHWKSKKNILSQ